MSSKSRRAYKEVRLQQLRSFCETARLGSMAAAGKALGVSQPAVWEQVHALEREFGVALIESHGRGSRLTAAGRYLAEVADPLVTGIDSLKRLLAEHQAAGETHLTVAAPQRILVEDLPDAVAAFVGDNPNVRLRLLEWRTGEVGGAVEGGLADVGVDGHVDDLANPRLRCEPAYEVDRLLITPADHPLARKRQINAEDLRRYPLVNAPEDFARPDVNARVRELGLFDGKRRPVEAVTTAVVRRYVELGFGIGIVLGRPSRVPRGGLHERPLTRLLGAARIWTVHRRGLTPTPAVTRFVDCLKQHLSR